MKKIFILLFAIGAYNICMAQYEDARNIDLENMIEKGDINAMFYLGFNYLLGLGSIDYQQYSIQEAKGIDWLKKASEKGQIDAMFLLGKWYQSKKEYKEAIKWLTINDFKEGFFSIEKSDDRAFEKYRRLYHLAGIIYRDGETVQDFSKAKMYFEKASTGRGMCTDAMCDLGLLYERGQGVEQDYIQAESQYAMAVLLGNTKAKMLLGNLYLEGKGKDKDYKKAYEYLKEAAEEGDNEAKALIAKMYYYGYHVEKNPFTAFNMLLEIVNKKNPSEEAMRLLSACYRYGQGTDINNAKAEYWIEQAAIFNSEAAKSALDKKEANELANKGIYMCDNICYEYSSPNIQQINDWKDKYFRFCTWKIQNFPLLSIYKISNNMIKKDPCLVYLILTSKSMESQKEKNTWFDLWSGMNQEKIDKLYTILYKEAYKLAEIEYKYKYKSSE